MKKQLLTLFSAVVLTISSAFATETNPVPNVVADAFAKEFKHTGDVQWKATDKFYKASFNIQGQKIEAFYDLDGKMIGLSRFIAVPQLPMALIKEVTEKSKTNTVTELFELLTDRGTEYFVAYTGDKGAQVYKSDGNTWVRY